MTVGTYVGQWKNDKREGHGVFTYEDGEIYDGQWLNDGKHGLGCCRYVNGDTCEGEWKHDKLGRDAVYIKARVEP